MRTRTPALAALFAAGAVIAPAIPADAVTPTDPGVPIAASATTITINGHGWGHAHGMSQYGAQGAAREGLTYAQILAFYYDDLPLGSLTGRVRVLITSDTSNRTTVKATSGLRLTDTGRDRTWKLPTASKHAKAWRLRTKNGVRQVLYKTGTWHRFHPGGHATLKGDGQFSSSSGPVTLRLASGDRQYRGALRLSNRDTVNVVGLEKYLRGVVPSEMPSSWKPAALQAQAVAARTYAAFERADNASRYFQVYDTTRSQVYKGVGAEAATTDAAIAATAGKIVMYAGKPAFTQFSSSSGGWTSAGSRPYLVAKQDIYDKPVDPVAHIGDPNFSWGPSTIKLAPLRSRFPGTLTSVQVTVRETPNTVGVGHVANVVLSGTGATPVTLTGEQFRSLYNLKSTYFSLSATP